MRLVEKRYSGLGLGLVLAGAALIPVSHFLLGSTPLTALGISLIVLGAVCLALGRARPEIPPEISAILLEAGVENIATIVEELGLTSKAIYLPSRLGGGRNQALIPLRSNPSVPQIERPLPRRLIVKYGPGADDVGLLLSTPGSATIDLLESKPGSSSVDLEAALSFVLIGGVDLVDAVRVGLGEGRVTVEVSNPRLEYKNIRLYQNIGSPLASIIASIAAEGLGKPLVVAEESYAKGKCTVSLEVLG